MNYLKDKIAYCRRCQKETRQVYDEKTHEWKCDDCKTVTKLGYR